MSKIKSILFVLVLSFAFCGFVSADEGFSKGGVLIRTDELVKKLEKGPLGTQEKKNETEIIGNIAVKPYIAKRESHFWKSFFVGEKMASLKVAIIGFLKK